MWYQIKSYLTFLWRSKNQHGVHSPFVFNLLTKCIYLKNNAGVSAVERSFDKLATKDTRNIQVTDLGAGSATMGNLRSVQEIYKRAGIKKRQRAHLRKLLTYLNIEHILELGTSVGKATVTMAANPEAKVTTVEGCPNTTQIATAFFKAVGLKNTTVYNQSFDSFLKENKKKYDLIYMDGGHDKQQTLANFELLLPFIHNDSLLLIDDIYWSPQMTQAWQQLCSHPQVSVSIDSYYWGWLFFRKEQPKQHFILRM